MEDLVQKRQHRARKVTWFLQMVPFIRFIGLTGSLAYDVAKKGSDIDIFIISKHGRIYTCRFFIVGILKLLQIYRSGDTFEKRAGKICPNRFVTDKYLSINPQNRYHAQEYTQMVPLFDTGIYQKFLSKNEWMEKYGYFPPKKAMSLTQSGNILTTIRRISEWLLSGLLGDWLEKYLKDHQFKQLEKNPDFNIEESGIYADNNEIRIHPHPR